MQFSQWSQEQSSAPDLATLLDAVAACAAPISRQLRQAAVDGAQGKTGTVNVQGEDQKALDVYANDVFLALGRQSGVVRAMVSEELDTVSWVADAHADARLALVFDPLDGSSNLEVNGAVGSIFSVLDVGPEGTGEESVLQAGRNQLAAGYILYGPATVMAITTGAGTALFALDEEAERFVCVAPDLAIADQAAEFSINASRRSHWYMPTRKFIDNCMAGQGGPYGKSYNMRWCAAMVADMHRILVRGGVFLYPEDQGTRDKGGRLRLMYEASPMAMLVEAAGGRAHTGAEPILDVVPESLHQRVGVIAGSAGEVARAVALYESA